MGRGGVRRRNNEKKQHAQQQDQLSMSPGQQTEIIAVQTGKRAKDISSMRMCPEFEETFAAVKSLYADGLKPYGRILRKRVAELAAPDEPQWLDCESSLPDVDMNHLRSTCEGSDLLSVQPEEGGDWSALIVGREAAFVDVYSPEDTYPLEMWEDAATYFEGLDGEDMTLPGGRYSCAQALHARGLAFLKDCSLGQVCHIVQLAISQKRLLGYLNGAVVPYAHSRSKEKQQCAQQNAPCIVASQDPASGVNIGKNEAMPMATWETARDYLRKILCNSAMASPDAMGTVPLSNVKRLFRSRFQTELSETMLGHSKLSDLLQDDRFSDICVVQLQNCGYVVVQVEERENLTKPYDDVDTFDLQRRKRLGLGANASADMDASLAFASLPRVASSIGAPVVQRTFIHASLPPPTPPPNARRRSNSLPKDVGCNTGCSEIDPVSLDFISRPLATQHELTESTADSASISAFGSSDDPTPSSPTPSCELPRHSLDASPEPTIEDPMKILLRECSLDWAEDNFHFDTHFDAPATGDYFESHGDHFQFKEYPEQSHRLHFCPDEPLALDEASLLLEAAPSTRTPILGPLPPGPLQRWSCLSPNLAKDGRIGSIALSRVQNTFIHSPLLPPTPLRTAASCRSRSLPKNVGSDKNALEATCQALGYRQIPLTTQDHEASCLPTPSMYEGYEGVDMRRDLVSPFVFWPPSPALTASPTYSASQPPAAYSIRLADFLQ